MKKKILFILPTLHAGGVENYVLRFIDYCGNKQYAWDIISLNSKKGDLHNAFASAGCKIHYLSIGYLNIKKAARLWNLLRKEKYKVICTFTGNFGGLPIFIAKIAGVPKRIAWYRRSSNAFSSNVLKHVYNKFANKLIRSQSTHILSNSYTAFNFFHGPIWTRDTRFMIIPNGIDYKTFDINISREQARKILSLSLNCFIVGHVGRFDPAKNHETIFQVAANLKKKHHSIKFLFCGKDTDSPKFRERLRMYDIEDVCICLGLSNKVPLVYKSMDIFFFPSTTEGQPNALIEAMISGLPVITSNIPPILEALPEHLHKVTNSPSEINTVVSLITDLKEKKIDPNELSAKNWAKVAFDKEKNFGRFINVLNS